MIKNLTLAVLGVTMLSAVALASPKGFDRTAPMGPQGFDNQAPTTVAGVLKSGYDDQIVSLQGRLTNFLGDDRYEFTDMNGDRIEVELDDDKNWSNISKDQPIIITGEVDKDLLSTTIEVKYAEPLPAAPAAK